MSRIEGLWDINKVEGFHIVGMMCEKACRGSGGPFDTERHQRKDLLRIKQKIQNEVKNNPLASLLQQTE